MAVYFVMRRFSDPGVRTVFYYAAMGLGHGYLLFTNPTDPGTTNDPLKNGFPALTTASWHPNSWDYADRTGGLSTRTPGRIWEQHPSDTHPEMYRMYRITADIAAQTKLAGAVRDWIVRHKVGYEYGEPARDPINPANHIGSERHRAAPTNGVYYSLMEQNCVWWATAILLQSGFALNPDTARAITEFNKGGGAAKDILAGTRSASKVNTMSSLGKIKGLGGSAGFDPFAFP